MVILSHMRSRISSPESGSCMRRTTAPMSLLTVSGASGSSVGDPAQPGLAPGSRAPLRKQAGTRGTRCALGRAWAHHLRGAPGTELVSEEELLRVTALEQGLAP